MMKKVLLVGCFAVLTAFGAGFDDGVKAYERGEYMVAFAIFEKLANEGDASAQNILGMMYDNGYGVSQDYQKAFYWYSKAADNGVASAQYNLGLMYKNGYGVVQDFQKAFAWYSRAANQGVPMA